jgi:hypothetical protein
VGRRGPPPISPSIARQRGTFRPYRHGNRAEHPDLPPLGPPPAWFPGEMTVIWLDIVAASPHLRAPDARAVAALVLAVYLHQRDAVRLLELTDPPEKLQTRVMAGARSIMQLSRELGLTSLARARLVEPLSTGEDEDASTGWELLRSLRVVEGGKR